MEIGKETFETIPEQLMLKAALLAASQALSSLSADVEAGNEVLTTRRGQAVARLVAEPGADGYGWAALRAWVEAASTVGPSVARMREDDLQRAG